MTSKVHDPNSDDRRGWLVVLGASIGVGFGSVVIINAAFPILSHGAIEQFGSSQVEIVGAITAFLFAQMLMWPIAGVLLDRFGSRAVAMTSITLFGLSLVLLSTANSASTFIMWFGVIGLVSAPTNVVSYTRVVSLWFDERRGLALGVMAAAQGVGAGILPPIVHYATAQGGWPLAVGVIAGIELLICLPSVAMLVREPMNAGAKASPAADPVQGRAQNAQIDSQSLGQIIRRPVFWTLSVAFSIIGFSAYSIGANLAPIFAELAGLDLGKVAQLQSLLGICVIPGRLLTGMALDRFPAHVVAIIVVALNALALALLVSFSDFTIFLVAMAILGFCSGGESNLMPFMAGRIFGVGSVSRVFGWFLFAFFIGALTGPLVLAKSAAQTGSYIAPLLGLLAAQIVIIALFWISAKGSVRPPVPDGAGA